MLHTDGRRKIAFLTSIDPQDKRSWSGIFYQTAQALKRHCGEVAYFGSTSVAGKKHNQGLYQQSKLLLKKFARQYFVYDYHVIHAKQSAHAANQRLSQERFDVIVAPASLMQVAFLETEIPIVIVEDGTFALLLNYYPQYTNLLQRSIRQIHAITERGIKKASALVYSSAWAAASAINDYHAEPKKVYVVPMGANFDNPPGADIVQRKKKSSSCRLLFVGVDWQRKGGEIAFETLLALEKRGILAELVICGCVPPKQFVHQRMNVIPFLDKNDPKQYKELEQLYLESDFFLLPTRNECYGIVFCEASAYGLPAITTYTGGVPEVVKDGENGYILSLEARGDAYADVISSVYLDEQQYAKLVKTSRAAYDQRLNWDVWGRTVDAIITDVLAQRATLRDVTTTYGSVM
jgi:glycosyltransferase involved in cell wall biosynthesis